MRRLATLSFVSLLLISSWIPLQAHDDAPAETDSAEASSADDASWERGAGLDDGERPDDELQDGYRR